MSSFLRKVAGAFVVLEGKPPTAPSDPAEAPGLAEITRETSSLLAQLEGSPAATGSESTATNAQGSLFELTAEDVFRTQQVEDTPNSALRLLKLIAGLSMFPKEQQVAMVRAMDSADDTWSEAQVVRDARLRQEVLRRHLASLSEARNAQNSALDRDIVQTKQNGDAVLAELDQRIAALQARREQEASATAASVAQLEQKKRELDASEQRARQGSAQVIQALAGLLSFLGASQAPESK